MTRRRHTQGITLLEVVIVVTIAAILVAGAAAHFRALRQAADVLHARREALQNARVALERMARHVRTAAQVDAISAADDTAGTLTLTDGDGITHVFALVGTELRYGIDNADSLLASDVQAFTVQGHDSTGAVANGNPAAVCSLRMSVTARIGDTGKVIHASGRARLRRHTVAAGSVRVDTTYASLYQTTGTKAIADYAKAFGAFDGDQAHKHDDEAGKYYGFQAPLYTGTVHRMFAGMYVKCKNSDKPLTVTVRHGPDTLLDYTFSTAELLLIKDVWWWQWFDVTDARASWTEADVGQLSVELWNTGDFEIGCVAARAVFDPTTVETFWVNARATWGNVWLSPSNALGAPDGVYAQAPWYDHFRDSFTAAVPDLGAMLLGVQVRLHGGPDMSLSSEPVEVSLASIGSATLLGTTHTISAAQLNLCQPYSSNAGSLLVDFSNEKQWAWADFSATEIRIRTTKTLGSSATYFADAIGWRIRYVLPQRGIIRWSE